MSAMSLLAVFLLCGQVNAPASSRYSTVDADGNPVISGIIRVQDEAEIPAMEAGVLTKLYVREGARVKKGDDLAQIDDRRAQAGLKVAEYNETAAKKRAEQKIEIDYAKAASAVANAVLKKALAANRIAKDAVSETEVDRAKLDRTRAILQIDKALNDQVMAGYDADTKTAEREAAEMALEWLTIRAPFDGDVVETKVHKSEWVHPGDTILKLMRFDKLYIEGDLYADEYDRSEVNGKPVTVEVLKARGRKVTVTGKVVHVEQRLAGSRSRYTVRAEVNNELINGSWLLQPGGVARMTIHLDQVSQETSAKNQDPDRARR